VPPSKHEEMKELIALIDKCKESYNNILVTGDFNAKSKVWSNKSGNYAGDLLEDFMLKSSYICMNDGLPTRRNSESIIDLVMVTPPLVKQISSCQTLVHENVRSDHISIMIDMDDNTETNNKNEKVEKLKITKTDWEKWETVTNEKFSAWNREHTRDENIDSMYDSFLDTFNACVEECTPKTQVLADMKSNRPPWFNPEVKEAKNALNIAKKHFRRRKTPELLQNLKEKEATFEKICDTAKTDWVEETCDTINKCKNPKEKWSAFHRLTSYQNSNRGIVLPLVNTDNEPVFDSNSKCDILKETFFGGNHIANEEFDEEFKRTVEEKYEEILKRVSQAESDNFLDREITEDEVEASLQKLENGKAPGPDNIFTDLLKKSNGPLLRAITAIFQKSFATGQLPQLWKMANVKFLQKPGKSTYYKASSYRPISLTSTLGKCLERVVNTRLYSYAEHNQLLDNEQDGFRERRGTTQALLRLVEDIANGFNKSELTAAIFVDMEKAFDTVWRRGLMVKLNNLGTNGKTWCWINDFLSERRATCCLPKFQSSQFSTEIGLPQGSVLSPLLFNLFISDMFSQVKNEKVKFADDGTIWKTGTSYTVLESSLQEDLDTIADWTKKWRMKLNVDKTECCLFRKNTKEDQNISFTIKGQSLKRVHNTKLLGVILDEKLTFNEHIQQIEAKAAKALGLLHYAGKAERITPENMTKLYRSLVVPYLEYAAPVWQTSPSVNMLEKIQRKGLRLCLGSVGSASCDGLEVQANVLPLDLRREEMSIRECAKILAKGESSIIKQKMVHCREETQTQSTKTTPMSRMLEQTLEMESLTGIDTKCIEQEISYLECLQPSRRRPSYWNNLGSSKSRTQDQQNQARDKIQELLSEDEAGTVVAFTDGSCRGNPGPCGAGACICAPGEAMVELKQPVSKLASILVGELVAIKMTLRFILEELSRKPVKHIRIMSDSQTAIGVLTLGWDANAHMLLIQEIQDLWREVERKGTRITLDWSPGHADIEGNEIADRLAKEGAKEAEEMELDSSQPISQSDIKKSTKDAMDIKWQRRWEITDKARQLFELRPLAASKTIDYRGTTNQRTLLQLQSGHTSLRDHLHRLGCKEDPLCNCGEPETLEHFLIHCPKYESAREALVSNIYLQTGIRMSAITPQLLLTSGKEDPWKDNRRVIITELDKFITESGRFSKIY